MIRIDPDLVDVLQEEVGDSLRTVATYDDREYEFHHLRRDIQQVYTRERIEEILEDLIVQGVATEQLESRFRAGALDCAVYTFEEAVMFHFPVADRSGLFVSIDRDADLDLDSIVSLAKAGTYGSLE